MANSAADTLEALKTARDAIIAGIAAGDLTVSYQIRGRMVTATDPGLALQRIEDLIDRYERKSSRATRSPFRVARLSRPGGSAA